MRHDPALVEAYAAHRRAITAAKLGETLDHFEAVHSGYVDYLAREFGIDFRPVLARLIDAGAPIADWRLDPRVADARWPIEFHRVITNDLMGNIASDLYRGERPDAFREVRNEYASRLVEWGFGAALQPIGKDGYALLSHLIKQSPTVEEFIDDAYRASLEVAA